MLVVLLALIVNVILLPFNIALLAPRIVWKLAVDREARIWISWIPWAQS